MSLTHHGVFSRSFQASYKQSLSDFRHFYDDIHIYGELESAEQVFYMIPGLNGSPGQVRFVLPALFQTYGQKIFVRCCYLDEFSVRLPIWEKYTLANVEKKRQKIASDLQALAKATSKDLNIIISSNGFYDFLFALDLIGDPSLVKRLVIGWAACSPDGRNILLPVVQSRHPIRKGWFQASQRPPRNPVHPYPYPSESPTEYC